MRKILVFAALLFGFAIGVAQSVISPIYPEPLQSEYKYATIIGFTDFNYVSSKIESYLKNEQERYIFNTIYDIDKSKTGKIAFEYRKSNNDSNNLYFEFNIFTIDTTLVCKSIKVTGDITGLIFFFADFWNTNLNINELKQKAIAQYNYYGDKATFYGSYITVENQNLNVRDFTENYRKQQTQELQSATVSHNGTRTKQDLESFTTHKPKSQTYTIQAIKTKKTIEYSSALRADEKAFFTEFLKPKAKGIYKINCEIIRVKDSITETHFFISSYKKSSSNKLFNNIGF